MQRNIQPNQSFVPASSLAQMQPTLFSYSGQPCGLVTSPMSLSPQTPTGLLSASPVSLSPQANVLYSPATPGLSPVIMMQPQTAETDSSDQPTDLSLKSSPEESSQKVETDINASQNSSHKSPKECFRESVLNFKQKSPGSAAETTCDAKEDPLEANTTENGTVSQSGENESVSQSNENNLLETQSKDQVKVNGHGDSTVQEEIVADANSWDNKSGNFANSFSFEYNKLYTVFTLNFGTP